LLVLFQWWIFTPDKAHTYKLLSIQNWSLLIDMKFKTIDKCSIEPGAKVIIQIDEASFTRSLANMRWTNEWMNELNSSRLVILKISKTTTNERWWDNLSFPVSSFRRCRICIATYICIQLRQDERKSTHILSLLIKLNRMSSRRKTYSDCHAVASSFWDCSTIESLRLKADVCN
jgi:hypothetical protein